VTTTAFDPRDARPERYSTEPTPDDNQVPNWRAASGETGEKPRLFSDGPAKDEHRSGLFGTGRAGVRKAAKPRKTVPPLTNKHKQALTKFYMFFGASVRPFDEFVGDTIIEQAPECAASVYDLAQQNDAFRQMILAFTTTSMWGAVVMAHLPIVLALARHSKNMSVKTTAAATFVALKMGTQEQAESLFDSVDEDAEAE
jgi:hypothetical protein